jgi:hypothetical protein
MRSRCGLRREKVAPRGLEELHHRRIFEGRRIGEVDHHLRACERFGQAFSRQSVGA